MDNVFAVPVAEALSEERSAFLRKVGLATFGGLAISAIASVGAMAAILQIPLLQERFVALGVMLGAIFGSQALGGGLVRSENTGSQLAGFALGTGLQGVAMAYLLLSAISVSMELYADPLVMIGQALGLVGLTVAGMIAYLMTGPKNLSMIGGALAALTLPMLGLMVLSFVFPINGPIGLLVSVVFVGVSAGGLLYNLNQVMHQMSTRMVVPAAYHVTLGVLVLFWNVLSLLLRLSRR